MTLVKPLINYGAGNLPIKAGDTLLYAFVQATASQALAAGNVCNLYSSAGAATVQLADSTDMTKPANCFVIAAVSNGATATVYFPGQFIDGLVGLTPGAIY